MSRIIDNAADCTIKQYMECAFKQRYRVLIIEGDAEDEDLQKAFELIYAEYVDLSGLFITREFELSAYIQSLWNRTNTITRFIDLQKRFIGHFSVPFVPAFDTVKKYGHVLYWNHESPDIDLFLTRLAKMEAREKKYEVEIKAKEKELFELRKKKVTKEFTVLESRKQFVTSLNRLQQSRFVINKNETSMEELAIMISDQREQHNAEEAQRSFKKK
jgi:hypothetical protein